MTQSSSPANPALDPHYRGKLLLSDEWESDEPPLETDLHRSQIDLILNCIQWYFQDRNDCYASGNTTIYYSPVQSTQRDFRGPDLYIVLGVDPRPRRSWMVWREGYRYPNVIIELLSDSTASVDRNQKRQLYQNIFKTPEYFWFDPDTAAEFVGLRLVQGVYQPIPANAQGWLWSDQLQLYLGIRAGRLRLFTPNGDLIPTADERAQQGIERLEQERLRSEQERTRAEQERTRAEQEKTRAEQAEQENEQLRQRLRDLGIDP